MQGCMSNRHYSWQVSIARVHFTLVNGYEIPMTDECSISVSQRFASLWLHSLTILAQILFTTSTNTT